MLYGKEKQQKNYQNTLIKNIGEGALKLCMCNNREVNRRTLPKSFYNYDNLNIYFSGKINYSIIKIISCHSTKTAIIFNEKI